MIADDQPRDLDRILHGNVLQQVERDAVRVMLEAAVALAMPAQVGRAVADRQRRR